MHEALNALVFHWVPSKALYVAGRSLSWDARCSGIHAGFGTALVAHLLAARRSRALPARPFLLMTLLGFLPMLWDVATIDADLRAPSNDVRFVTGALFGTSLCVLLYPAFVVAVGGEGGVGPEPGLALRPALICLGAAGVCLARFGDGLPFYFLLEGLAWLGISALAVMLGAGALRTALLASRGRAAEAVSSSRCSPASP